VISRLVLDPAVVDPDAILGLGEFSHIEVIFYFHKQTRTRRGAAHPRGKPGLAAGWRGSRPLPGRPDHLGMSRCARLDVTGLKLTVRGLDPIDGTPILDIKPYTTKFSRRPESGSRPGVPSRWPTVTEPVTFAALSLMRMEILEAQARLRPRRELRASGSRR
jgi:tRNA (Thr-GGU) A37 N-methylase